MPAKRALLAKLARPRLHAPVKRTRLFKLLDQGERYPIAWVSGPPGSGKTTLVASYLEARKAKTFWYQVDEGDRDPATFFHYLAELAAQSKSRRRAGLPVFTADYLPDLAGFTRRYFREVFVRLGANAVLVLDNCQDAAGETFDLILREACQQIPPDCRVVALSRSTPPAELSREVTNQGLQTLAWPELRLTDSEAQAIVKASSAFNPDKASTLNQQCDGWVGGLVLLLARGQPSARNEATHSFESREALFDYFAEEVLSRAPPATQRLLLQTSLFPHTTVSMALSLTNDETVGDILATLYRQQYFIDRKVEAELTYQYHDLFREFLLRRVAADYEPAQLSELRQRAAEILEGTGRLTEAVDLFKQAQDWGNITRLIRVHAETLLGQGRWQTLNAWFEAAPERLIEHDPWLLLWRANAQIPVDAAAAYEAIRRAHAAFVQREDWAGELCALCNASVLAYTVGASFVVFDEWFPRLEQQLAERGEFASVETGAQAWMSYLTMNLLRCARGKLVEQAEQWLAQRFFANELQQGFTLIVGDQLLHQAIWAARPDFGLPVYAKLERLVDRDDVPPEYRYHPTKDLGYWHFFNAEFAQSLPYFDRAAQLASEFGMPEQHTFAQCYRAMALCGLGEVQSAEAIMRQIAVHARGSDVFSSSAVDWAWGVLEASRGNYATALKRVNEAAERARAGGFTLLQIIVEPLAALYAAELGRDDEALAIVAHVRALTHDTMCGFPHCLLNAIEAEVCWRRGDRDAALKALSEALRLAHNARMAGLLVWAKPWLPRQLAVALKEDIETATVKQIIRRFNLAPVDAADETWPCPIKIRTLGAFDIRIDDAPVTFAAKAPKKTLALLKAIIAFGAREVKVEDLLDALWGDSESDAAREALKIALLRLRKLLGSPDAVESQQGRLSLNPKMVWCDALAFEAGADRALNTDSTFEARAGVLTLYRGNFLAAEEEQPWSVLARERLRRKFVHLVASHAKELERSGDHAAAEAVYLRGLDADNLIEQFYQGLMRCHLACGQRAEGMDVFRRLRQMLSVTLSVAPSVDSQVLFEALLQGPPAAATPL